MELPVGTRLRSAVDTTEVVVVRAPSESVDIRCGGQAMVPVTQSVSGEGPIDPNHNSGTLVGKRYVDDALGLELLCTKGGEGSLAVGEAPLLVKAAKPLPSSD
jgi:hypothetical protein